MPVKTRCWIELVLLCCGSWSRGPLVYSGIVFGSVPCCFKSKCRNSKGGCSSVLLFSKCIWCFNNTPYKIKLETYKTETPAYNINLEYLSYNVAIKSKIHKGITNVFIITSLIFHKNNRIQLAQNIFQQRLWSRFLSHVTILLIYRVIWNLGEQTQTVHWLSIYNICSAI